MRKAGGVCIADEVQSGFGRTGSNYWGFQTQDVIPDIVTMAKVISYSDVQACPLDPRKKYTTCSDANMIVSAISIVSGHRQWSTIGSCCNNS